MDSKRLIAGMTTGAARETAASDNTTIERIRIGTLSVPTGRIVAGDPYMCAEGPAFQKSIAPGRYAVDLSFAALTSTDRLVALAILVIRDVLPANWELAVFEDGQTSYGVDWGTGCFMDAKCLSPLAAGFTEDPDFVANHWHGDGDYYRTWQEIVLDADTNLNMLLFTSGRGDGAYSSYWGYDAADNLVCLVTDFGMLEERPSPGSMSPEVPSRRNSPPETSDGVKFIAPW